MLTFKEYCLIEGTYPGWVKVSVGAIVLKIRNLSNQIQRERDPVKQNRLLAQQSKLLAYVTGLGIALGTSDDALLKKLQHR